MFNAFFKWRWLSRDLIFTGLNQSWKIISGPVTLVLIPLYLTPELQGYWFTIMGLSLLMIFADLGFSNITLQFAAHEFAYLNFNRDRRIEGDENHLKRLASFFVFSLRWALSVIIIAIPVISAISLYLLLKRPSDVHWFLPWLIYLISSILVFFNNLILYFFEGCNSVALVQRIRLSISMILSFAMWAGLVLGYKLLALSFSILFSSLCSIAIIYSEFKTPIAQFITIARNYKHDWRREFFPLLWRYAISFASGYFVFQIYTPLIFYYHGPIEAGKVGISMALWAAINAISGVWITAVTPRMNIHISRKERDVLDSMFSKRLVLSVLTFLAGAAVVFSLLLILKGRPNILSRFADITTMSILAIAWFLQTIVSSLAVYVRAHKQEPFMLLTFLSAIYVILTTVLCANFLPPEYFFLGFLSSYLWVFPWVLLIFYWKRREMKIRRENVR